MTKQGKKGGKGRKGHAPAGMPTDQRRILAQLAHVAAAAGIRSKRKKGKPRGKPFKKGQPPPPGARPFQPGESGNPDGRPPSTPEEQDFDTIVKGAAPRLARVAIERLEGHHLDASGITRGLTTPEVRMFENIWALAGRPIPRKVELSGPGGGPIATEETGPARSMLLKLASEDLGDDDDEDETPAAAAPAQETPPPAEGSGEP